MRECKITIISSSPYRDNTKKLTNNSVGIIFKMVVLKMVEK